MYVTFDIANGDLSPQGQRRGKEPQEQAILLPDGRAAGTVQSVHRALVVADKDVARVERQSCGARELARPERVAAGEVEAADPPLVGQDRKSTRLNSSHANISYA